MLREEREMKQRGILISLFVIFTSVGVNFFEVVSFAQWGDAKDGLSIVADHCTRDSLLLKCKVTVKNLASHDDIKDVQFSMRFFAPSGTFLNGADYTVYQIFPKGKVKVVEIQGVPHPQAENYQLSITAAKWNSD
jgi:hypothetical protein